MRWRRYALVVMLAAVFSAGSPPTALLSPGPADASVQTVALGQISITFPAKWESRPMPAASEATVGIQASLDLPKWGTDGRRAYGMEAWWVNATKVPVPTDYYYLAAEGPTMRRLPAGRICSRDDTDVLANRRPLFDRRKASPGDYVATASGTCWARGRGMRWASFVAAPGYGPVRRIGIPESGLYFVLVVLPDGPWATRRAERLITEVSFGGATVSDFLRTARAQAI